MSFHLNKKYLSLWNNLKYVLDKGNIEWFTWTITHILFNNIMIKDKDQIKTNIIYKTESSFKLY